MKQLKRRGLSLAAACVMTLTMLPIGMQPVSADGADVEVPEGYVAQPVSNLEGLKAIKTGKAAAKVYYYLTDDIVIDTAKWVPMGDNETSNAFYDVLDGQGHSITFAGAGGSGVSVDGSWNGGLFFAMNGEAMVKNLITKGAITSSRQSTGTIVGQMMNGSLDHCVNYATVTVSSTLYAGGLAGRVRCGVVSNSMNYGAITGKQFVGGLVGSSSYTVKIDNVDKGLTDEEIKAGVVKAYIVNCANFGEVTGTEKVGGILGLANKDKTFRAENCYNTGLVSGPSQTFGAIVCAVWPNAVNTASCYALDSSCTKFLPTTTKMTAENMQTESFAETLNARVTEGFSYCNELDGELIPVKAARWRYAEGTYPVISDGIVVKAAGKYGEPLLEQKVSSAKEMQALAISAQVPALGGYTFAGWNEPTDEDAYARVYDTLTQVLELTPVYTVDENSTEYTLQIEGATAQDGFGNSITTGRFDDRVIVTADEKDKTVAYWELDGAKVGFGQNTYQFYISGNTIIKAVYDAAVPTEATVVLQRETFSTYNGKSNLTVVAQTSIPEEYTFQECGVVYTGSATVLKNMVSGFDNVDEAQYVRVKSSQTSSNRQYMTHLLNVETGKTRYARAYAIVITADGEKQLLWSDVVVQFKTNTDGVSVVKGSVK